MVSDIDLAANIMHLWPVDLLICLKKDQGK